MKSKFLVLFSICLMFSCVPDDSAARELEAEEVLSWTLRTTSNTLDLNNTFEQDVIIWRFDTVNLILRVENNNTDDTIFDGLDSGSYSYSIDPVSNVGLFLFIDGIEYGGVPISTEQRLIINRNLKSDGSTETGEFVLDFNRITTN